MIFDFKKNRLILLLGMIVGSIVVVVLTLQQSDTQTMVLAIAFMMFFLWFILRRMTIKEIQDLQQLFMIERDAYQFKMAYDHLLRKGTAFDKRWVITKHQNYILGAIFNGDEEDARFVLDELEKHYGQTLHKQPVYHYLDAVIKGLISLYYEETPNIIESINIINERFDALPAQMQKQMESNVNSFHRFFKTLDETVFIPDAVDIEAFNVQTQTMTPFLQAAGIMVLKRKGLNVDNLDFDEKKGKLFRDYTFKPLN